MLAKIVLLGLGFVFFSSSCKEKTKASTSQSNADPTAHIDISALFISEGNEDAETVWLFEQGGPKGELFDNDLVDDFPNPDVEDLVSNFPKPTSLLLARVHQAFTYDHDFYRENLTREQAQRINNFNIFALHRVIKHFKNQGKTVWVFGHSYGCFILTYYLSEKGPEHADKFIPMGCRLDMEMTAADGWSRGEFWHFPEEESFQPIKHPTRQPEALTDPAKRLQAYAELVTAGYLFQTRFTQDLLGKDLSNVIYVVGLADESTGILTQDEKNFLTSHNAELIEIEDGDHSSMFSSPESQDPL